MKTKIGLLCCGAMIFALQGAEIIKNGAFQTGMKYWWTVPGKSAQGSFQISTDPANSTQKGSGSIKISRTAAGKAAAPRIGQNLKLEPNCKYLLTAWVKGENLAPANSQNGAYIGVSDGSTGHYFGRRGRWRWDTGTFGWSKITIEFHTKNFKADKMMLIAGLNGQVTGTVWFDDIAIKKIQE